MIKKQTRIIHLLRALMVLSVMILAGFTNGHAYAAATPQADLPAHRASVAPAAFADSASEELNDAGDSEDDTTITGTSGTTTVETSDTPDSAGEVEMSDSGNDSSSSNDSSSGSSSSDSPSSSTDPITNAINDSITFLHEIGL